MKTPTRKRIGVAILVVLIIGLSSLMPGRFTDAVLLNGFLTDLQTKIKELNKERPEDRVYAHFDKTLYKPGETIWFNAFVRNGVDLAPSVKSGILNVELIDPKGTVIKRHQLIANEGRASGDFTIDNNALGGLYKVKAYTMWQKNENTFFEKEIQVQKVVLPRLKMKMEFQRKAYGPGDMVIAKLDFNTLSNEPLAEYKLKYKVLLDGKEIMTQTSETNEVGECYVKLELPEDLASNDGLLNVMVDYEGKTESISRSIPITLGNIALSLYPEGGDLIEGLKTRVAFKALNEFNKPADIEGVVVDGKNNELANFSSFHNGMGAFEFTPEMSAEYRVLITKPEGIKKEYHLPRTMKRGWILNVENREENLSAIIRSTENETMSLLCQVRGKDYFAREIHVKKGENEFKVPLDKFPIGVCQITLFDSRNIERAERLVFVNKEKQMNIEIETNKEKYLPREKVEMTLKVTDERGLPIPANLSLSVVDDKLLSFSDDKSSHILSSLLLEQDVLSKVEEPKFYFDKKEKKAGRALDYLLMTDGWRRFKWEQVINDKLPTLTYEGQKSEVSGRVLSNGSKPIEGATIMVNNDPNSKVKTNEQGEFTLNGIKLYHPVYAKISAPGYAESNIYINSYTDNYLSYLYPKHTRGYYSNSKTKKRGVRCGMVKDQKVFEAIPNQEVFGAVVEDVMSIEEEEKAMEEVDFDEEFDREIDNVVVANKMEERKKEKLDQNEKEEKEVEDLEDMVLKPELRDGVLGEVALFDQLAKADRAAVGPNVTYYRAKEFASPNYKNDQKPEVRSDFRSTTYWNGNIEVNSKGEASIEFYNNDDVSSFRATVEGIGVGLVGRAEKTFYTQLPFTMFTKVPHQVLFEDELSIPLTLKNTTDKVVVGNLKVRSPKGFQVLKVEQGKHTIPANATKTIYLNYKVLNEIGEDDLQIAFESQGLKDAFSQKIKIGAKGFPVELAFSDQEIKGEYLVDITHPVKGSVVASLKAFPNVVNDLMTGIESIIREPSGCFEQTSMSNYPNIMALNYMKATGLDDPKLLASIDAKLDRGYKKLISFETGQKGYEWFGSAPGHEALTAYGLMQFNDMKNVYAGVSDKMVERTANWIMKRKDGKGCFKKNPRALDQFGRASDDVTNAYIVYALSEAGYDNMETELEVAYKKAMSSNDGYQLGLVVNTLQNLNDKRSTTMMKSLLKLQKSDGSFPANHSITYSGGKSLDIETTSIAVLAMLKAKKREHSALKKAVNFLVKSRSGSGGFGSTQGTVLALKALSEYAINSKHTEESGILECYIDGKLVASKSYEAGESDEIVFNDLGQYLKEGKHNVKIITKFAKKALPYTLAVNYHTTLPKSAELCNVDLSADLNSKSCKVGETVRLTTVVKNKQEKGMPMTMAVVGIPSGLSAQPWQLKELQEKGRVDFYEVADNFVVFYFRDMAPAEQHKISLDLKAEIPGTFEAPASSGYLYYTNEYKCWSSTGRINIKKN